MDLKKVEKFLNQKKAAKEHLEQTATSLRDGIVKRKAYLVDLVEALDIMNVVSILVQQEFKEVVEILVTQALKFIFGDSYSFEIENEIGRNQPEINIFIVIDGEKFSPRDDEFSGGQADVVSFALRIILWAIQYDKTRPILFFDEPFRCLHGTQNAESLREMIQYLSKTLGIQFVIITQDEELTKAADVAYVVTKEKAISKAEILERVNEYAVSN